MATLNVAVRATPVLMSEEATFGVVCHTTLCSIFGDTAFLCDTGVYFSRFRRFKCSIDHAKRSFYKAANSVFGKVGQIASEEVTLQLVKSDCIPILLYGLEVCELINSQMASLDFTISRFL